MSSLERMLAKSAPSQILPSLADKLAFLEASIGKTIVVFLETPCLHGGTFVRPADLAIRPEDRPKFGRLAERIVDFATPE